MTTPPVAQKEKQNLLAKVATLEKQLWGLIRSKGFLHSDSKGLYQKIRFDYEKAILEDHEQPEVQDIEYSLWKLHYKLVDEFRKRIKRSSANSESTKLAVNKNVADVQRSDDNYVTEFRSFLTDAIQFYGKGLTSTSIKPMKLQKCLYLCHRFLVCLGDLSRYKEQHDGCDVRSRNWSTAATHYLEATRFWPDSGNPQNQLAVLATYVGDEFLALYRCIRSLAVREPFPDAWDNLILLFERNRSSPLCSLSGEARFDFLQPSEKFYVDTNSQSGSDSSNGGLLEPEHHHSAETNLMPLIIRTLSFFFLKSSLNEFPSTFSSTLKWLDVLMELDDSKLEALLESYGQMHSFRKGPFRAVQIVSVFIFALQNLFTRPGSNESKDLTDNQQKIVLTQMAFAATLIIMGRVVDRCLKANRLDSCPLLPAVLVFIEWFECVLDKVDIFGVNEKGRWALLYFSDVFNQLLERLNTDEEELKPVLRICLWEDYELRGFIPVASAHRSLDFSDCWECIESFQSGVQQRACRIVNAAIKISSRSECYLKWISYDKLERRLHTAESNGTPDGDELKEEKSESSELKAGEPTQHISEAAEDSDKNTAKEFCSETDLHDKSVFEEEEIILFKPLFKKKKRKPLMRFNSAPLCACEKDHVSSKEMGDQSARSEECWRRATSILIVENWRDPSGVQADITNV